MSEFVRFYKECESFGYYEGIDGKRDDRLWGCKTMFMEIGIISPCLEECGIRCKRYKRRE